MIDLLGQYNSMVQNINELDGYSMASISEDNSSYIALNDRGVKIKGGLEMQGPITTAGIIYAMGDIMVAGKSLRQVVGESSFANIEVQTLKQRVNQLESLVYSLATKINTIESKAPR